MTVVLLQLSLLERYNVQLLLRAGYNHCERSEHPQSARQQQAPLGSGLQVARQSNKVQRNDTEHRGPRDQTACGVPAGCWLDLFIRAWRSERSATRCALKVALHSACSYIRESMA